MRTVDLFRDALRDISFQNKLDGTVVTAQETMDRSPKVRMHQAAEYWTLNAQALDPMRDLPNIAPPWQSFYFEYRIKVARWAQDMPPEIGGPIVSGLPEGIDVAGLSISNKSHDGSWDVAVYLVSFVSGKPVACGALEYTVLADGRPELTADGSMVYRKLQSPRNLHSLSDCGLSFLSPMFLAMCFCHCKAQVEIRTEEVPPKLAKRQAEKGRARVDRWHLLDIEPVRRLIESARVAGKTGIKQALHLCRGHFRDYKDGRGLFGRYHGVYWVAPQLKGSKKKGVTNKDYDVKVPQDLMDAATKGKP